ncbi:MAG: hypothetical protein K2K66_07600 [Ruminococcus sp.]|nr:hypothetical protein [Ruminococcus sp.]
MKKATLFFCLALVPVILFLVVVIIGMIYGDVSGIFDTIDMWLEFGCKIPPQNRLILAFIVPLLQIIAIANYVHVRNKVPLLTIIFFYISFVSLVPVVLFFLIAWIICIFNGYPFAIFKEIIPCIELYPELAILALVIMFLQISAIINYFDTRKKIRESRQKEESDVFSDC